MHRSRDKKYKYFFIEPGLIFLSEQYFNKYTSRRISELNNDLSECVALTAELIRRASLTTLSTDLDSLPLSGPVKKYKKSFKDPFNFFTKWDCCITAQVHVSNFRDITWVIVFRRPI